jgi:DNA adenine methylase
VIREDGERLAALIEMTPWAREEYELSYAPCDDPMERARRFVVRVHQGHGTDWVKGGKTWALSPVRSADTSGEWYRALHWQTLPPRIAHLTARLSNAEIDHKPAIDLIAWSKAPSVLIYADPPYVTETRQAKLYQHEMTDADHLTLLDALDAHPGPVVLSGYHCALYDDRLRHWSTREKQAQAEKGNTRTEVLWLNQTCIDRLGYGPMFEQENSHDR